MPDLSALCGYAMEVRRTVFALVVVYWLKCGVCTPPLLLNYDDDRFEGSALNGPDDEDDEEASALPPEIYDDKHSMYVQPKFSTSQYDENDVVHHRIADSAFTVGTKNGAAAPEHDGLSSTAVYVVIASLIASIIFAVIILYIARRRRAADGQMICAGVLLSGRVVFTSFHCLHKLEVRQLQVYYEPNSPSFIDVTHAAHNPADRTVLLHLRISAPICKQVGERRLGVVHWKRMSQIYIRSILSDRSKWRLDANWKFLYKTIRQWQEYGQVESDFRRCPAWL
ncbi:hypothetical protein Tcan_05437 [Toxocara canis]|uniref:Uncharacterized protein n=1 Tax=Toxocara canis TaxID=6265 RepID=A0A0B2UVF8_TOXCA|nr:hypothetical protein Tcan_05437 [Toxocara canis]